MKKLRWALALVVVLSLVSTAGAQFNMQTPHIRGVWNPVVGSGAAYTMETKREGKVETEFAIVGTETVNGKPGHWLEMTMTSKEGTTVMKNLMVFDGNSMQDRKSTRLNSSHIQKSRMPSSA